MEHEIMGVVITLFWLAYIAFMIHIAIWRY